MLATKGFPISVRACFYIKKHELFIIVRGSGNDPLYKQKSSWFPTSIFAFRSTVLEIIPDFEHLRTSKNAALFFMNTIIYLHTNCL